MEVLDCFISFWFGVNIKLLKTLNTRGYRWLTIMQITKITKSFFVKKNHKTVVGELCIPIQRLILFLSSKSQWVVLISQFFLSLGTWSKTMGIFAVVYVSLFFSKFEWQAKRRNWISHFFKHFWPLGILEKVKIFEARSSPGYKIKTSFFKRLFEAQWDSESWWRI